MGRTSAALKAVPGTKKLTSSQREAHRERVRKSAEARTAATNRLIKLHTEEFEQFHEEEKAKRGIKSRQTRRMEADKAKALALLDNPEIAAMLRQALAPGTALAEASEES